MRNKELRHYRFSITGDKITLFNLETCGCCNNICVSDSFPAYEFMTMDNLLMANIPLSVIPERKMVLDPVSGESVCNVCLA